MQLLQNIKKEKQVACDRIAAVEQQLDEQSSGTQELRLQVAALEQQLAAAATQSNFDRQEDSSAPTPQQQRQAEEEIIRLQMRIADMEQQLTDTETERLQLHIKLAAAAAAAHVLEPPTSKATQQAADAEASMAQMRQQLAEAVEECGRLRLESSDAACHRCSSLLCFRSATKDCRIRLPKCTVQNMLPFVGCAD